MNCSKPDTADDVCPDALGDLWTLSHLMIPTSARKIESHRPLEPGAVQRRTHQRGAPRALLPAGAAAPHRPTTTAQP